MSLGLSPDKLVGGRGVKIVAPTQPAQADTRTGSQGDSSPESERETREGLKRLADFVRKRRQSTDESEKTEKPIDARVLAFRALHATEEVVAQPKERRADESSFEFTQIIVQWSQRPRTETMASVLRGEMERRRGLQLYRAAQAPRSNTKALAKAS